MFAVGRKSPKDTFRIVCINRAFEEAGQHGRDDMIGLQLDALLPSAEAHEVTIGACFLTKSVELDSHVVKLELWDTAG